MIKSKQNSLLIIKKSFLKKK